MTELIAPLAPDCEALRRTLVENPLPPVWPLEAATATAARVAAEGKADLDVAVEVKSAEGELLAELTVQFHFRKLA